VTSKAVAMGMETEMEIHLAHAHPPDVRRASVQVVGVDARCCDRVGTRALCCGDESAFSAMWIQDEWSRWGVRLMCKVEMDVNKRS